MSVGLQQVRDELGNEDTTNFIFKRFSEKINVTQGPIVIESRNTTSDTIWGVFTWGQSDWDGDYGSIFILGDGTLGVLGSNKLGSEKGDFEISEYCPVQINCKLFRAGIPPLL